MVADCSRERCSLHGVRPQGLTGFTRFGNWLHVGAQMRILIVVLAALSIVPPAGRASELRIDASMCNFDVDAKYGNNLHGAYTIAASSDVVGDVSTARNHGVTEKYLQQIAEQKLADNGFASIKGQEGWVLMDDVAFLWVAVSIVNQSKSRLFFYNFRRPDLIVPA